MRKGRALRYSKSSLTLLSKGTIVPFGARYNTSLNPRTRETPVSRPAYRQAGPFPFEYPPRSYKYPCIEGYLYDAEGEGFEPSIPCGMPPFQDGALGHYATLPYEVSYLF